MKSELLLQTAGALQLLQLPVMRVAMRALGWSTDLTKLVPVNQRLVLALTVGVVLYVNGTGLLALLCPEELGQTQLGIWLCLLQTIAWGARAIQQLAVVAPQWPNRIKNLHWLITGIYSALALIYGTSVVLSPLVIGDGVA